MIVDVLRNDLGRVCRPGSVRVPRLCRLERTAAVQHLVSTVTGRLAEGRDAFDLLAASLPGRLDHRRPEDPGDGDPRGARAGPARPVHRGARLDRAGRRDGDVHPHPDVRRRRAPADPPRRRRDHLAERPGGRMGRDRREGARSARRDRRRWRSNDDDVAGTAGPRRTSGSTAGCCRPTAPHLSVFDRGFQLGDGVFETLRVRAGRPTELAEHVARLRRSADGAGHRAAGRHRRPAGAAGSPTLLAADGLDGPDGDASVRITVSRGRVPRARPAAAERGRRRPTIAIQAWPVAPPPAGHLERGLHLVASAVRRDPANPLVVAQDDLARRLRLRPARGAPGRRRRRALPDHRRPPVRGDDRQHLPRAARAGRRPRARDAARSTARSCPGRPARGCSAWAARVGLRPVEARLTRADLAAADEAFLSSSVAGILPVTRFDGRADRRRAARDRGRSRAAPEPDPARPS